MTHHQHIHWIKLGAVFSALVLLWYLWSPLEQNARAETESIVAQQEARAEKRAQAEERILSSAQEGLQEKVSKASLSVGTLMLATSTLPAVSAGSVAVVDLETEQELYMKNADEVRPIASISKLVTALSAYAQTGLNTAMLAPSGEVYTFGDLLRPLFLKSDNAVADSIAQHFGTTKFVGFMNTYVKSIGMQHSAFADPSGISPKNVSTARDLVTLSRFLVEKKRDILTITTEKKATIVSTEGVRWSMDNQNVFAREDSRFLGGKLGFTSQAKKTSIALLSLQLQGERHLVAIVVLGSDDWKQDTHTILTWLESQA